MMGYHLWVQEKHVSLLLQPLEGLHSQVCAAVSWSSAAQRASSQQDQNDAQLAGCKAFAKRTWAQPWAHLHVYSRTTPYQEGIDHRRQQLDLLPLGRGDVGNQDTSHTGIHKDLTTTMLQQFPLAKPIIFLITESSLTPKVKKLQLTWLLIITAEMQHKEEMFISADEGGMD